MASFSLTIAIIKWYYCFLSQLINFIRYKDCKMAPPSHRLSTNLLCDEFRAVMSYYRKTIALIETPEEYENRIYRWGYIGFISKQN